MGAWLGVVMTHWVAKDGNHPATFDAPRLLLGQGDNLIKGIVICKVFQEWLVGLQLDWKVRLGCRAPKQGKEPLEIV